MLDIWRTLITFGATWQADTRKVKCDRMKDLIICAFDKL